MNKMGLDGVQVAVWRIGNDLNNSLQLETMALCDNPGIYVNQKTQAG